MPNTTDDTLTVNAPRPTDQELIAALGRAEASGDHVSAQRLQGMLYNNQYRATPAPQQWENTAPEGIPGAAAGPAAASPNDWEVLKYLAGNAGVNALSGIKGLSTLPGNIVNQGWDKGMDQTASDIAAYQAKYGPSDNLTPGGVAAVQQHLIPAVTAVKNSLPGQALSHLSRDYGQGTQEWADLAGKVGGPRAAGVVGATGDTLPMLIGGEGLLAKYAKDAAPASVYGSGAGQTERRSFSPLLPDGAHQGTLEREAAANQRRAEDGLPVGDVPPSEFQGRQAEHEGAVAQRMAQPAFTKTMVPTSETDLSGVAPGHFSAPDNALSWVAHDPETGQLIGHVTAAPRGGAMQGIRMDVDPAYRGTGVGPSLLQDAVGYAHSKDMPYVSDTQVSIPAARTYEKLKGVSLQRNPSVDYHVDDFDGEAGRSMNGQPVYAIHPADEADDAVEGEPEPNSWIARQAYAEGGEAAPLVSGIGHLAEKYATADPAIAQAVADHLIEKGGISYHPTTSTQPTAGYAVAVHPGREQVLAEPPTGKDIQSFMSKNSDVFDKDPMAHLGGWENGGKYYLDVAHIDPDLDSAMAKGRQYNQMAIFDLANGKDIVNPHYNSTPVSVQTPSYGGQPSDKIRQVAQDYMKNAGLPYNPPQGLVAANPERGRAIASAYEAMQHAPEDPRVKASYDAMISETMAQYQAAKAAGLKAEFIPAGAPDPYGNPRNAVKDITDNNHMWVFPTSSGFGSPEGLTDLNGHPLLQPSGETFGDIPATNNDIFRVVHDYFGHAKEGNGFRASGEENAWANHAAMYSPEARPAMTSETRGQNSWVNFGPQAEANKGASGAATTYAPQKAGLLPDEFNEYADGGEVEPLLGGIAHLAEKYAGDVAAPPNPHASHLAEQLAENGSVTYNPSTGDLHHEGYIVPQPGKSVALDATPTAHDLHDFLIQHQDAFDNPKAVVHAENIPGGAALHVAIHEPDFENAMLVAQGEGAPGVRELHTGNNFSLEGLREPAEPEAEQVKSLPEMMGQMDTEANQRQRAPWVHGQQTVAQPQRNAFPGIYGNPKDVVSAANAQVAPESDLMQRLFGVSRQDLSDQALARQGNELGVLPGAKQNPSGAESARNVMTPQNEQRLIDVLTQARGTPLYTGMTGWYNMDPLYERFRQIYGEDEAPGRYSRFNTLMGMASPGSDVGSEIARGTSAHWLSNQGRFQDFLDYAGIPGSDRAATPGFPEDMLAVPGHAYHRTAQGTPMAQYLQSGEMQMKSPKVPMYIGASGVPETGFQTSTPVGDAHWARGVGLADTRNWRYDKGEQKVPGSSVSTPEMQTLAPWWRDRVAAQSGLESVPAQALAWGAFAPSTGVETAIGAPKLELLSQKIGDVASRLGVSPETARDMVITGQTGAF